MAEETEAHEPWFAGKDGSLLVYRVNRRPRSAQFSLFSEQPEDFFDHLVEVLLFGEPVITGRRYQRAWLLGNRAIDLQRRIVTGHVGWERSDVAFTDKYDSETQAWVDTVDTREAAARAPFAVDGESQLLVVLRHRSFNEQAMAQVFTRVLTQGEVSRELPTTEWDVEPLLDEIDFREWVGSVDVVRSVTFVAKLPNPDVLEEFDPIFDRMKQLKAKKLEEEAEAEDPDIGLEHIMEDPNFRAFLAMAANAYGYVRARGSAQGRDRVYDQRAKVRRQHLMEMPSTWGELVQVIVNFLLGNRGSP